ncbi:hypothetical protein ANO11243_084870 [Dothideomycetidae sp. 11243]|nr:hypothetical protein ANO11243_084870 [fungal sp. No.11243]
MPSITRSLSILAPLALAHGAVMVVKVADSGLDFNPSSLTAAVGDQVEFQFVNGGHSVVEGSFANPCQPSSDSAWNSGFVSQSGGQPWTITINSTDPIYFYCSVGDHCQSGMGGAINAPSSMSAQDYINAAKNAGSSNEPKSVQGGMFGAASSGTMTSSGSSMMTATSAMSSATGSSASASATATAAAKGAASTEHGSALVAIFVACIAGFNF